jgi:hypothetical protein
MEADEVGELKEQAEHGSHEEGLRPVAFTMAVLAVLVAITTVLGHRTHTEAILTQNRATDQWNFYQAHKIRSNDTELTTDLLGVVSVSDPKAAAKLAKSYADHQAKWAQELDEAEKQAHELEADVSRAEARANRFDLAEALLEIGLVISSVTLLTRSRIYWYLGIVFSLAGIVSVASAYFLR